MCVICSGSIKDGKATPADGIAFDCPKHGAYAISKAALHRFLRLDSAAQEAVIDRAKLFAADRHNEVLVTALDI